jgi:rSAM/selenodomain-associated transferase 1
LKEALIIFIKNPQLGKVKTRLAAGIGDQRALEIYLKLMNHTRQVCGEVHADRFLFYSEYMDNSDAWDSKMYSKHVQLQDPDLGKRMLAAFEFVNELGYDHALIVGSDIPALSAETVKNGFILLNENEAVIGPAEDGGYYSIGFNFGLLKDNTGKLLSDVFLNKSWSHDQVCKEAISAFNMNEIRFGTLPVLSDLDTADQLSDHF